jgi:ABC-2 type transport system permease protein
VTGLFVRLKWRLIRNGLRNANAGRIVGLVLSCVFGVGATIGVYSAAMAMRSSKTANVAVSAGLACCVLVFVWWLVPLLTGGVDETVDPSRLRLLPLTDAQLRRGQIVAGLIGIAPVVGILTAGAIGLAFTRSLAGLPVVAAALTLCVLVALVGSRAIATGLGAMRRSRRGRELSVLVMVVCVVLLTTAYQAFIQYTSKGVDPTRNAVARVMSWTPPGMAGRAVWQAGRGNVVGALPLLAPMLAMLVVAGWLWTLALNRLLTTQDSAESGRLRSSGQHGELFTGARRRLPRNAAGVAVAREMLYLRRSPGRRNAALLAVVFTVVYSVIIGRQQIAQPTAVFYPVGMLLFGGANAFNQYGWSPAEFWLDAVSGVDARIRIFPRRLFTVLLVFVAPFVAVLVFFAFSRDFAALLIAVVVLAFCSMSLTGVGAPFSMKLALPVADNGNPWANRKGNGGATLMMFLTSLVGYLPTTAIGGLAAFGMWWARPRPLLLAVIAVALLALGGAVYSIGGRIAAARLAANDPDILLLLETRTVR